MPALVDLGDWRHIVRLPHLVLVSFHCEQGKLHRGQVDRFLTALSQSARECWEGLPGQLLDEALRESSSALGELAGLAPPAVVTATRQSLNVARRALDAHAFEGYVSALQHLHRVVREATPTHARVAAWLSRGAGTTAFDAVGTLLEETLGELDTNSACTCAEPPVR